MNGTGTRILPNFSPVYSNFEQKLLHTDCYSSNRIVTWMSVVMSENHMFLWEKVECWKCHCVSRIDDSTIKIKLAPYLMYLFCLCRVSNVDCWAGVCVLRIKMKQKVHSTNNIQRNKVHFRGLVLFLDEEHLLCWRITIHDGSTLETSESQFVAVAVWKLLIWKTIGSQPIGLYWYNSLPETTFQEKKTQNSMKTNYIYSLLSFNSSPFH